MYHLKIYEDWKPNAELINYAGVLYEYQGIYFLRKDNKYVSVRLIPDFAYRVIANEIYEKATGKAIETFKSTTSDDIDSFEIELNKLTRNHKLLVLVYIFDNFYNVTRSVENVENLLFRFEDLLDDINDTRHTPIGNLGDSVEDAVITIDKHFYGDEMDKYNL